MGAPYIYDISRLRVNIFLKLLFAFQNAKIVFMYNRVPKSKQM